MPADVEGDPLTPAHGAGGDAPFGAPGAAGAGRAHSGEHAGHGLVGDPVAEVDEHGGHSSPVACGDVGQQSGQ